MSKNKDLDPFVECLYSLLRDMRTWATMAKDDPRLVFLHSTVDRWADELVSITSNIEMRSHTEGER